MKQRPLQGAPLTAGKKWGLAVDMTKLNDEIMDRCAQACHTTHNVPNIGNPKEEIKWIWKETYEHTFPGQESEYTAEKFHGQELPGPLQSLHQPALLPGPARPRPPGRGRTASS